MIGTYFIIVFGGSFALSFPTGVCLHRFSRRVNEYHRRCCSSFYSPTVINGLPLFPFPPIIASLNTVPKKLLPPYGLNFYLFIYLFWGIGWGGGGGYGGGSEVIWGFFFFFLGAFFIGDKGCGVLVTNLDCHSLLGKIRVFVFYYFFGCLKKNFLRFLTFCVLLLLWWWWWWFLGK